MNVRNPIFYRNLWASLPSRPNYCGAHVAPADQGRKHRAIAGAKALKSSLERPLKKDQWIARTIRVILRLE
jgi:hypothetical protein